MFNQEQLIEQIAVAPNVDFRGPQDLPPAILAYVKQHHSPFGIEAAYCAPHLGYEVFLETGLCIFFNENGQHLNHNGMHGDVGNHHGGMGWGFNQCMAGDTLNVADLPQEVVNYIAANYPGQMVSTVVLKPSGMLSVELEDGTVLIIDTYGNFIHTCDNSGTGGHGHSHGTNGDPGWQCEPANGPNPGGHGTMGGHHGSQGSQGPCWGGAGIQVTNLPDAITSYLDANHPDATVAHAMQTFGGNYFLRLSDCARVVFDEDGNLIFDSGA